MDPYAEFATLRPDATSPVRRTRDTARPAVLLTSAVVPPAGDSSVPRPADDEQVLPGVPAELPEITLATILPAPVDVAPLPQPTPITLTDIALAPIAVAPIDIQTLPDEENP